MGFGQDSKARVSEATFEYDDISQWLGGPKKSTHRAEVLVVEPTLRGLARVHPGERQVVLHKYWFQNPDVGEEDGAQLTVNRRS